LPSSHGGSPGFKSPIAHHIETKRLFGFPRGLFFRFVSTIIFIAVPIPEVFTEAEEVGLSLPGLALVQQLYPAIKAQGNGRSGTHALFLALASLNGGAK